MRGLTDPERAILTERGVDHFDREAFSSLLKRGLVNVHDEVLEGGDHIWYYTPSAEGQLALRLDALAREAVMV